MMALRCWQTARPSGGVQLGGHGLPAGVAAQRGRAAGLLAGLDRFAGDGDVQPGVAAGGEVVLGCVPGVEQGFADRVTDPGGGQVRRGGGRQRVQRVGAGGAVAGGDGGDDLPAAGEGLQVIQLAEAAFLQRHDPAGQAGDIRPGRAGQGRRNGRSGDRRLQPGRGPRGQVADPAARAAARCA
jgi:hypothetical protein